MEATDGLQVARVAHARGISEDQVWQLIAENTRPRFAGIFGGARRKRAAAEPGPRSRRGKSWRNNSRDLNGR
ncbi:potassium-transporting ATPase subunit C [Candidatus Binatus soli]|uniref:potassium-transporting ATPase subunit C n=1 Tax=Candidatus Binatus soli TaxID=1953413 RepID=UPI003D0CBB02